MFDCRTNRKTIERLVEIVPLSGSSWVRLISDLYKISLHAYNWDRILILRESLSKLKQLLKSYCNFRVGESITCNWVSTSCDSGQWLALSCKILQNIFAPVKAGQLSTTWQIQLCVSCCYRQQFGLFYRRQRYRHKIQVSNKLKSIASQNQFDTQELLFRHSSVLSPPSRLIFRQFSSPEMEQNLERILKNCFK